MDANAAPPEPPAGAEAATQPSDANATPPAPPQPFAELLETVREERQQDRKIRLNERFSRMALKMLAQPAEQRAAMAAYQGLSLEVFDYQLCAQAWPETYGVLRNESLAHMESDAGVVASQEWEKEDRAFIAETEREMVAAAAAAVEGCAAATEGQACYICMDGGAEEGLVRGCSCRGGSGFAHISCLARQANIQFGQHLAANQRSNDTRDVFLRWVDCRLCEQTFHGPVAKAMARACVSTYASRSPDDGVRISVMNALATHLPADEAVTCREQILSDYQQLLRELGGEVGADEASLIVLKTGLGRSYVDAGRHDDALAVFREVHKKNVALRGPEHEETLYSAGHLTNCLVLTGRHDEAKTLLRDQVLPAAQRVLPPEDDIVISCTSNLARALYDADSASVDDLREGVALLEALCTTSRRVYGAEHPKVAIRESHLDDAQAKLAAAVAAAAAAAAP
jgi:tetratricopeptide (TPR) repeat protein